MVISYYQNILLVFIYIGYNQPQLKEYFSWRNQLKLFITLWIKLKIEKFNALLFLKRVFLNYKKISFLLIRSFFYLCFFTNRYPNI